MAITNRLKIIAVLTDLGWELVDSPSTKYEKLNGRESAIYGHSPITVWIGKSGAIRRGNSISDSSSITDRFKSQIDELWDSWDEGKQKAEVKRVKQLLKGND